MTSKLTNLFTWSNYPQQKCRVTRPEKYRYLHLPEAHGIPRGQGCSYGDAALSDGYVILTERLNRCLAFNPTQGILQAEAGITLADILKVIVPAGWFLPVTPGTSRASLGGCVAADVHGKNHHRDGSLGNHVLAFELIVSQEQRIICTPDTHPDIFWATIGGLGLTGIIGTVTLKLKPLPTTQMWVKHYATTDLEHTFACLSAASADNHYSVAWLDGLASGAAVGRSIIMTAEHATLEQLPQAEQIDPWRQTTQRNLAVPIYAPPWLLCRKLIRRFNQGYYWQQARKIKPFLTPFERYFYPLDSIQNWNRLYGKSGFLQYQCVIPTNAALLGIKQLLDQLLASQQPVFLGVLKRLGAANKSFLSFPKPGYTLALDIPLHDPLVVFQLCTTLDAIVMEHDGRVYLAKDARLNATCFRSMYPEYAQWLVVKQKVDPDNRYRSNLSQRLKIGEPA